MCRILVIISLITSISTHGYAQADVAEELPFLRVSVGGGYLLGGQFYSESFTYNPALSGEVTIYHPLSATVNIGLGVGATISMIEERFLPVYVSFLGFSKPDRSCTYFLINAGYSSGWRRDYSELSDYDFDGGLVFKTGIGKRFLIGERSFLFGVALQHQWAEGSFDNGNGFDFEENLNYDWLAFELRFFY